MKTDLMPKDADQAAESGSPKRAADEQTPSDPGSSDQTQLEQAEDQSQTEPDALDQAEAEPKPQLPEMTGEYPGLIVMNTPIGMAKRVVHLRTQLLISLLSLICSVALLIVAMNLWEVAAGTLWFWFYVAFICVAFVRLIFNAVQLIRANNVIRAIDVTPALQILHEGILVDADSPIFFTWDELTAIYATSAIQVPEPRLHVDATDSRHWSVPIIQLETAPQDLDCALRAFSRGRFGLDTSRVDQLW